MPVQWDCSHFITYAGVVKLFQLICGVLCVDVAMPYKKTEAPFMQCVIFGCLLVTLTWIILYLLSVPEPYSDTTNWELIELVTTSVQMVSYIAFLGVFAMEYSNLVKKYYLTKVLQVLIFCILGVFAYTCGVIFCVQDYIEAKRIRGEEFAPTGIKAVEDLDKR